MISPAVGCSRFVISLATVDFPQPDSPTMPSVSPGYRSKETPSTACTAPICFLNRMPRVSGKCLTRLRTCSTGSRSAAPGPAAGSVSVGACVIERLLPEVAGARPLGGHPVQRRDVGPAHVPGARAARVEGATGRDVQQVGRQALDRVQL